MALYSGNILTLLLLRPFMMSFALAMPSVYPMFEARGLDLADIALLQSAFSVVMVAFEIPSGVIADRWGGRTALMLGAGALCCGSLWYALEFPVSSFVVAESLLGIGYALVTGSDQAFLYGELVRRRQEHEFGRVWANMKMVDLVLTAGLSVVGGVVAAGGVLVPFFGASGGFLVLLLGCGFLSRMPARPDTDEAKRSVSSGESFQEFLELVRSSRVSTTILGAALVAVSSNILDAFSLPVWKDLGVQEQHYGNLIAATTLITAFAAKGAPWLLRLRSMGLEFLIIIAAFLLAVVLAFGVHGEVGVVLFLIVPIAKGLYLVAVPGEVNRVVSDGVRASAASLVILCARLAGVALFPVVGWLASGYGLGVGLSVCILLIWLVSFVLLSRTRMLGRTNSCRTSR